MGKLKLFIMANFRINVKEADCSFKKLKFVLPANSNAVCDSKNWLSRDVKIDAGTLANATYIQLQDGKPCSPSGNPSEMGYYSEDGSVWYYWDGSTITLYQTC